MLRTSSKGVGRGEAYASAVYRCVGVARLYLRLSLRICTVYPVQSMQVYFHGAAIHRGYLFTALRWPAALAGDGLSLFVEEG